MRGGGRREPRSESWCRGTPAPVRGGSSRSWWEDLGLLALVLGVLTGTSLLRAVVGSGGVVVDKARAVQALRIDIDTAPWYEWTLLDGIGEARARRIVAYRERNGPFRSIEDLAGVPGLPRGWHEKVREHLVVAEAAGLGAAR